MDLSLPSQWPSEARFDSINLVPAPLYTLVDLTEDELQQVHQACESGCVENGNEPNTSVRIAPQPRFIRQPLRAVFDHHVEMRTRDAALEFDPKHFIVVVDEAWQRKGVLMVTLDDEESEGSNDRNVDSFIIKAGDAGLSIVNIQVGNMDWAELKSNYELQPGGRDNGGDDLGGPPPPKEDSIMGFYIPIYIHSQLQPDEVLQQLEPLIRHKTPDQYACRILASLTPSSAASSSSASDDLVAQAAALHPLRCARNKWLHPTMLLVVDTSDPFKNGMLMVRLDWAGLANEATLRTKDALIAMGATLAGALEFNSTVRLLYNCQYGLQRPFMPIAHGDAKWPSESARRRPKFAVCQYNTPGEGWGFGAELLYPGVPYEQEYGQEQLVYDQELILREEFNGSAENFEEAVQRFPMICRENRVVENFDTSYFIVIDRLDIADAGVLLVRRCWDGIVWGRTDRELMELDIAGVRSMRAAVKDAINILTQGRAGITEGMATELVEFFSGSD